MKKVRLSFVAYDTKDVYGHRKNYLHSPWMKNQLNIDTSLMWLFFFLNIAILLKTYGANDEYQRLRYNVLDSDMGRFSQADLI